MTYKAVVAKVINVQKHPNADRLVTARTSGYTVILGKHVEEDTLGVMFSSGGRLSPDMLRNNNLYRHTEENNDPQAKPGFFEENGKVRAQQIRGIVSEGFWSPISCLEWTGQDLSKLKVGDQINVVNGHRICEKYFSPATQRELNKANNKKGGFSSKIKLKELYPHFKEHSNTEKLRNAIATIPNDRRSIAYISYKIHGTSGRTGRLLEVKPLKWFHKFFGVEPKREFKYISGTRRVTMNPKQLAETGSYSGKQYRAKIHNKLSEIGLYKGETLYYEIVGFAEDGSFIMGAHNIEDKELKKVYGSKMVYSYGCDPKDMVITNRYKVFIYRITMTDEEGRSRDLPYGQLETRCKELGLKHVILAKGPFVLQEREDLFVMCRELSRGPDPLDPSHIKEGVVVTIEHPDSTRRFKFKNDAFTALEGIRSNEFLFDAEDMA